MFFARVTEKRVWEEGPGITATLKIDRVEIPRGIKVTGVTTIMLDEASGAPLAVRMSVDVGQIVLVVPRAELLGAQAKPPDEFETFMSGLMK